MRTYLRMIRMIRPYLARLSLAILFMVLFSSTSVFSITMISPFLRALFDVDGAKTLVVGPEEIEGLLKQDTEEPRPFVTNRVDDPDLVKQLQAQGIACEIHRTGEAAI